MPFWYKTERSRQDRKGKVERERETAQAELKPEFPIAHAPPTVPQPQHLRTMETAGNKKKNTHGAKLGHLEIKNDAVLQEKEDMCSTTYIQRGIHWADSLFGQLSGGIRIELGHEITRQLV